MAQSFEITDFSGGVTDYHLNAPQNKMRTCDNLLLIPYQGQAKPFTRPGSDLLDIDYPQLPSGEQRGSMSFHVGSTLFVGSANKLYRDSGSGWVEVVGPTSNPAFHNATTSSVFTYSVYNNQVFFAHSGQWYPQKLIRLSGGSWQIQEVGLPQIDMSAVTKTPTTGGGNAWVYKLVHELTWTDSDGVIYKEYSETSDIYENTNLTSVSFTTLPVLANSTNRNFDTTNVKKVLYRTTNGGDVFYKVAEIANATTSYNDNSTSDAALVLNETLYTTGGVVEFAQPPKCKIVHIANGKAYYAGILDGTEDLKNLLYQSIPNAFYALNPDFYTEVDSEIIAVSSTKSNPVLSTDKAAYRVDGEIDELGRGNMTTEIISDSASAINAQCMVQTLDGVFWTGVTHCYFSDGYRVIPLNGDYDITYAEFVSSTDSATQLAKRRRVQGKYDRRKKRVYWTIQHESQTDCDKLYVLDLNYGIRENASFTTWSGASFSPTAIEFDPNGDLIRCDRRGYILKHAPSTRSDIEIDTAVAEEDWIRETIIYTLETVAYNFGTTNVRKFVPRISVIAEDSTNLSLQMVSINDDGRKEGDLKPIRYRGSLVWQDDDLIWGDPGLVWNKRGLIDEMRRFPKQSLRCNYKAIRFTNAFVVIVSSDLLGTASINATAKTATLTDAATKNWPVSSQSYYIAFEADGYVQEFLITNRTDDVLTYSDALNVTSTAAGQKWVIRGLPKNEVLNLLAFSINYETYGQTQNQYQASSSGEVSS